MGYSHSTFPLNLVVNFCLHAVQLFESQGGVLGLV